MSGIELSFDIQEQFPQLTNPPIVEASIQWQAKSQGSYFVDGLEPILREKFPDLPHQERIHEAQFRTFVSDETVPPLVEHRQGLVGIRLRSHDEKQVIQVTRDSLTYSLVHGYQDWLPFQEAARNAWTIYCDLASPVEIQEVMVRYINHIPTANSATLGRYLLEPPTRPANLELAEFVFESRFTIPGRPYGVRVIKVMQPTFAGLSGSSGLFIDLSVFTIKPMLIDSPELTKAMSEIRWLKNKVFFALLTEEAIKEFGGYA
jgi:uncharacterized protein (TIGR04255 family)